MLVNPNLDKTPVPGCYCVGDVAVRMRKVPAIQRECVVLTKLQAILQSKGCIKMRYGNC